MSAQQALHLSRADERTIAVKLGMALDDMAVAPEIYRRAKERGIETWLPL